MIFLASPTFDIFGHIEISPLVSDTLPQISRRVSRVATIDGGVAINDGGYSDGDITLNYLWRTVSKPHNDLVARMVKLYPTIRVSTPDGVFLVAPDTFAPGVSESSISLLVISKLSQD